MERNEKPKARFWMILLIGIENRLCESKRLSSPSIRWLGKTYSLWLDMESRHRNNASTKCTFFRMVLGVLLYINKIAKVHTAVNPAIECHNLRVNGRRYDSTVPSRYFWRNFMCKKALREMIQKLWKKLKKKIWEWWWTYGDFHIGPTTWGLK